MFDRQRSSKPQLQRKVASKTREQLETDASQKEVCPVVFCCTRQRCFLLEAGLHAVQAQLLELRSTMSKEKAEIDELM